MKPMAGIYLFEKNRIKVYLTGKKANRWVAKSRSPDGEVKEYYGKDVRYLLLRIFRFLKKDFRFINEGEDNGEFTEAICETAEAAARKIESRHKL